MIIASSLYTILACKVFHRDTLLLYSGEHQYKECVGNGARHTHHTAWQQY